jgi:N-acyl-D-amino-acid deacylase
MRRESRTAVFLLTLLLCILVGSAPGQAPDSWVIVGARVADGTGSPLRPASVRVRGDRIVEVGQLQPNPGERVVDAAGLVLAPGFIDIHNHSTEGLLSEPAAASQVSQGITTLAVGADGASPWPIRDYLRRLRENPAATNVVVFAGHATIRRQVMGEDYRREATDAELTRMEQLVAQAMREGAAGLSTGLEYEVGGYASTDEVVRLAAAAARLGGIYMSHIRDEADRTMEALAEAIAIGERADIAVQISHIKLGTVGVWGKAGEAVRLIEAARARGTDVTADAYPYDAWASTITVLVPAAAGKRHDDPEAVARGLADVGGAGNVTIIHYPTNTDYEFRTLEEIARERGISPVALYIEIVQAGGAGVVCRSMTEDDIRTFYQQPWVMVASDGGIGMRHPRGAGSFPRVLGRYVREKGWLTLEEAIRKMTSLPAARLDLEDRGVIRPGAAADLVLFDPERVLDRSTFAEPFLLSEGIVKVWVNGVAVWDATARRAACVPAAPHAGPAVTGARPGRVLTR